MTLFQPFLNPLPIQKAFLRKLFPSISFNFLIQLGTYNCLLFGQCGGTGFYQEQEDLIPQLFNINCGFRYVTQ